MIRGNNITRELAALTESGRGNYLDEVLFGALFYRIHKHHDKIGPVEVATIKADVDWGEVAAAATDLYVLKRIDLKEEEEVGGEEE